MSTAPLSAQRSLPECLARHAQQHGDRVAVTFVNDDGSERSWTYQELWSRACGVARRLPPADQSSPRALLLFPPGLDFLAGFLGCQIAGWVPVPTCYPKPGRAMPRLDSAARDCAPSAIIADQSTLDGLDSDKLCEPARDLPRIAADGESVAVTHLIEADSLSIDPESLALLQYTSGSTSEPKGVMVRHASLIANLEAIRRGFQIDYQDDCAEPECGVFWLPLFHDMGLIGGLLEPLYVGARTVLMSPRSFLSRPIRWLQHISDYGAVVSGAPNFAYQLCVDRIAPDQAEKLDLSRWRIAFSGAEPVLARTLQAFSNRFASCGFSAQSFYPCYGLAEATLLAAGGAGPAEPTVLHVDRNSLAEGRVRVDRSGSRQAQKLVSCGSAVHRTQLVLVDPQTHRVLADTEVGEIWLRGESISQGYWNRGQANSGLFDARLADGESGFCRSGDLGFVHRGNLYLTGRIKDVIILRGRNLFPQDVEATVRETMGANAGQCAAFSVAGPRGETLAILAEIPRRADTSTLPDLARRLRRAIIEVHEVDPRHVLLVRQATAPLTSSGKIQRNRCREMFEANEFQPKYRYDRSVAGEESPLPLPDLSELRSTGDLQAIQREIADWMTQWLVARAGVTPGNIDRDKPFSEYGLDSLTAVELSGEIEDWSDIVVTPADAWNHPTVVAMSTFIAEQIVAAGGSPAAPPDVAPAAPDDTTTLAAVNRSRST